MTTNRYRNYQTAYEDSNWIIQSLLWLLFIGLFTGLITIALINLKPYTLLMAGVAPQTEWILQLPLIGPLLERLSIGASYIGAILIWAPVQILECLWLIIALDTQAQKNAIDLSNQLTDTTYTTTKKNRRVRQASKKLSGIPFFFIRWSALLALAAYTFDLVVGLRTYPLWKDWNTFTLWSKSLNPMWINSQNAIDLAIMLFSFEAVLILTIVVGQWLFTRNRTA
jgi:hypothetical protein